MTKYILDSYKNDYKDVVVIFANTGKERLETLDFVERCDKEFGFSLVWVEALVDSRYRRGTSFRVVNYETASRSGKPFEDVIKKYGIPNLDAPFCTRELKKYPITAYVKSLGWPSWHTAIGIRVDEIDRMSPTAKADGYVYPLVSWFPTTKEEIVNWWAKQKFQLGLKEHEGNCDCCWKKSLRKLLTLAKANPKSFAWWSDMENKYSTFANPQQKTLANKIAEGQPRFFNRNHLSIDQLLLKAKQDFVPFVDNESLPVDKDLDLGHGCSESCEPF